MVTKTWSFCKNGLIIFDQWSRIVVWRQSTHLHRIWTVIKSVIIWRRTFVFQYYLVRIYQSWAEIWWTIKTHETYMYLNLWRRQCWFLRYFLWKVLLLKDAVCKERRNCCPHQWNVHEERAPKFYLFHQVSQYRICGNS